MITWNTPAGNLGTITERNVQNIELSASTDIPNGTVTYSLIAGKLPRGLRLTGNKITGSAVEVRKFTESKFVVRATDAQDIEDRTFILSVDGADIPEWVTPEGYLNVGQGNSYFVLDNAYVKFKLEVNDTDEIAGDVLTFYISPNSGELPPGLSLSRDGVISGYTDPIFALEYSGFPDGSYDTQPFDYLPLDIVDQNTNGYDTFFYDNVNFDYNEPSRAPRRLSRSYAFTVIVTDGVNSVERLFKIWVVTEEFLKADNSILQVDTNLFQADATSSRFPLWITDSYLGQFRANNYVTIFLDVYDPPTLEGVITYFLLATNPGTYKLTETGQITTGNWEIGGKFPIFKFHQKGDWSSTANYKAGDAVTYQDDIDSSLIPNQTWVCLRANKNIIPTEGAYWTKNNVSSGSQSWMAVDTTLWDTVVEESISVLPPGMTIDQTTGEIAGRVPYQSRVKKTYSFSILAVSFPTFNPNSYTLVGDWNETINYLAGQAIRYNGFIYVAAENNIAKLPTLYSDIWLLGTSSATKTFSVDLIGEIESAIEWITDSDLGTIKPNKPSKFAVEARSLLETSYRIGYELVSGALPPGLEFLPNGQIKGKIKQFGDSAGKGLTRFYDRDYTLIDSPSLRTFDSTFDNATTTFDKKFKFTIKARDSINFAETFKEFYFTVEAEGTKSFANVYLKAFQNKQKRLQWYNFITDATIFRSDEIYRYGDNNFGVQNDLKMLVYAGIESKDAVEYIAAMSKNHYRKRILFGNVKSAKAKDPLTQETIYEVIYVEIIDEFEKNGKSIGQELQLKDNTESKVLVSYENIRVDSNIPFASDSDHQRVFPNSIKNMRRRIKEVGDRDREFLPLWMRSVQDDTRYEPGYVKALTLCYAKPGKAESIMTRIKASNFNFKDMDFEADRYIIDIINSEIRNGYLVFPQRDVLNKLENPAPGTETLYISGYTQGFGTFDNDALSLDADGITFDQE